VVSVVNITVHFQNPYVLPTEYMYVFRIIMRTKQYHFPALTSRNGFCDGDGFFTAQCELNLYSSV
jgi:hypothetical protein